MAQIEYTTGGGVIIHQDRMLLLERPARQEVRLPKGHIDPGETPEEAALRETREETGYADLEIVVNLGVRQVEFDYKDDHYRRQEHYFIMRLGSERRIARSGHDEAQFRVRWMGLADAPGQLTYPAEQAVAQAAVVWARQQTVHLKPNTT